MAWDWVIRGLPSLVTLACPIRSGKEVMQWVTSAMDLHLVGSWIRDFSAVAPTLWDLLSPKLDYLYSFDILEGPQDPVMLSGLVLSGNQRHA